MADRFPERIDPLSELPGIVAHHLKKYEFARSWVHGIVLDIACGVGYGSAHLTPSAERVVGVEINEGALQIARERYRGERCTFVRGDAQRLPFRDSAADSIVCFEGIEHFADPPAHVNEVARVLNPQGLYLVSTPVPGTHQYGEINPYHLYEFELEHLVSLLSTWFDGVEVFRQRRIQTPVHRAAQRADILGIRRIKVLRPLTRLLSRSMGTAPGDQATLEDFMIDEASNGATEFVAICRGPRRDPR